MDNRLSVSGVDGDYPPFSVLLPVHGSDDPEQLSDAIASVIHQRITPDELLIVGDTTVDAELEDVIGNARERSSPTCDVEYRRLDKEVGLGYALATGVKACSHELVARMDADDISVDGRFNRQLEYFRAKPRTDVLGGYVAEFDGSPEESSQVRELPTDPRTLRDLARRRCPLNHPTVMFRRSSVLAAGNYRDVFLEDYDLWGRMVADGATVANLPEVLVKMRAGDELFGRRGGIDYVLGEIRLFVSFYRIGFVTLSRLLTNVVVRIPIRLAPSRIRAAFYRFVLRNSPD
jgi:glycosyltransferase involved in cell wall biosynthesis